MLAFTSRVHLLLGRRHHWILPQKWALVGMFFRQDGYQGTGATQFNHCHKPSSIINTSMGWVYENVGQCLSDIVTFTCVKEVCDLWPQIRRFSFTLSTLPHTPLVHVYCVHKLTKGSNCLGVVPVRHQAVSLAKWQALSHWLLHKPWPTWWYTFDISTIILRGNEHCSEQIMTNFGSWQVVSNSVVVSKSWSSSFHIWSGRCSSRLIHNCFSMSIWDIRIFWWQSCCCTCHDDKFFCAKNAYFLTPN